MFQIDDYHVMISTLNITSPLAKNQIDKIVSYLLSVQKRLAKTAVLLAVDADAIAGQLHLKACIHQALKAFQQKEAIANTLSAEIMLFLSGNRQISKAIKQVGLTNTTKRMAVIQLSTEETGIESSEKLVNDLLVFLKENAVTTEYFQFNVKNLPFGNEKKIMNNLAISEEEIALFTNHNKKDRSTVIQQLALEKSALLNINK